MIVRGEHHSLPKVGELANGDRAFMRVEDQGRALFGVIDGLGHGPDAERVSIAAVECLTTISLDLSLHGIMEKLHSRLTGMRGAAATICLTQGGQLDVCAVGNVELRCSDMRYPLVFSAGILGVSVRKFRVCSAPIERPVRFIAFSDGISSHLQTDDVRQLEPLAACRVIMQGYRRTTDDATVLVADLE